MRERERPWQTKLIIIARRDIWPGGQFNTDPRRLWDFLERIGAVIRPPDRE